MHVIVLFTIVTTTVLEFFTAGLAQSGLLRLLPEVFSGVIAAATLMFGIRRGFTFVAARYWIVFGALVLIMICGVLNNSVGTGPLLTGMRFYLRAMPMFLLPAVYPFTEKQIEQQMKLILGIAALQIPLACYQRYIVWSQERHTGDAVSGTMIDSGVLSIFLICCVLVLIGFFMQKRIGKWAFFALFFALLLPTTINETKATVVLLPIGLLTTIVAGSPRGKRVRVFGLGVLLLAVFGAILVPVYDAMEVNNPYKQEQHLVDFFTNQKQVQHYLESKKPAGVGTQTEVRRGDALAIPFEYISEDPIRFAFGLGIGNATHSNLGEQFTGDYYLLFQRFTITSLSVFLLEIGMFGTALLYVLYAMLFVDSIAVARMDSGPRSAIAAGWIGVVALMAVATLYISVHIIASISYLFWYYSGLVAARRVQLTNENRGATGQFEAVGRNTAKA